MIKEKRPIIVRTCVWEKKRYVVFLCSENLLQKKVVVLIESICLANMLLLEHLTTPSGVEIDYNTFGPMIMYCEISLHRY